ncbi:MAG: phage major capsid protein [Anaerolineae bacterium]
MDISELMTVAKIKASEAKALLTSESPDMERANALLAEATAYRERAEALKAANNVLAAASEPVRPELPTGDAPQAASTKTIEAAHVLRFGSVDEPTDLVMREIYGGDYRQIALDQIKAFMRYLRTGTVDRALTRQVWGIEDVKSMLKSGMTVAEIKSTMVEGQDTLGGYAVPPQISNEILGRLPGLTVVRGGGARVIQTASNAIQWLKVTGGDSQYSSGLRGQWDSEVATPSEKSFTFGLETINVHTYTYKTAMSQSLVEDAGNIVSLFTALVTDTLAVDEDAAFLVGDGIGKPRGILPSASNSHGLTEVVSGNASTLTVDGVKKLRRGVASQYRRNASWIGNSATAGVIEAFKDGQGRFFFEYLDVGEMFMRHPWRESEAMPDIAPGAYPLIYGDLSGYCIVERLGLSVVRFQDSATGINKVEFHVRRRLGGDVLEPWKFAVQKIAAS